jgi:hypothetical protein
MVEERRDAEAPPVEPPEHEVSAKSEPNERGEGRRDGTPYQHAEDLAIMMAKSYASLG